MARGVREPPLVDATPRGGTLRGSAFRFSTRESSSAEGRHLERQRDPRPGARGPAVDRARIARRVLPPGDQSLARARSGAALRPGGVLVLLARAQGLLGRLPAPAQEHVPAPAPLRPSGFR